MKTDATGKVKVHLFICLLAFQAISCAQVADTLPLKDKKISGQTNITRYLNQKKWDELFPHRYGIGIKDSINHNRDFYSFKAFTEAAKYFPEFTSESGDTLERRELAAFLANVAQETSGGWADAPGGYFKWGLYFLEEGKTAAENSYADTSKHAFPPVIGKKYYGRGPKQLSWNYNYGQFSQLWYGNKDTLLQFPEKLSADPVVSFASAIWFWMTPQKPKPSCHDIITGKWQPGENDILKGRKAGFGATVNVINGGVECGQGTDSERTAYRYQYYLFFCNYFHVSPGDNITCADQKPFNQ